MAVNLIAFPFRFNGLGEVATHEQNSDQHLGEELATLICTKVGERILTPGYGVIDFTYSVIDKAELELKISKFEIPVRIVNVTTTYPNENMQSVIVEFDKDLRRNK